jgi:glycosidase
VRNVAAQEPDPDSLLSFYKSLLRLRKECSALRSGDKAFLGESPDVLAYERIATAATEQEKTAGPARIVVVLNFADRPRSFDLPRGGAVLLGTNRGTGSPLDAGVLRLAADEAVLIGCGE